MKIISFLGFNEYKETTYLPPIGQENKLPCTTPFFQEALVQFYQPESLIVLLTDKVENQKPKDKDGNELPQTNWQALQDRIAGKVKLEAIKNIPEQNTPKDIWYIFEQITRYFEKGDSVIFDITHSFRSIPIVALLSVSYLRTVREVNIQGLLYGAFEAKDKDNKTPTFDLLPIVSLLDWITATDQFIKTGNGETLANLLNDNNQASPARKNLAENISGIAQDLENLRPMFAMEKAYKLPEYIKKATPTFSETVSPFATLLEQVEEDYGKFGLEEPTNFKANPEKFLNQLLIIIEWYVKKKRMVQALCLMREWLPCLLCYHFELDAFNKDDRSEMELLLSGGKYKNEAGITIESKYFKKWQELNNQKRKKLTNLWGGDLYKLAKYRNDVLHAGFRQNPESAEAIIKQTEKIFNEVQEIAKKWKLI